TARIGWIGIWVDSGSDFVPEAQGPICRFKAALAAVDWPYTVLFLQNQEGLADFVILLQVLKSSAADNSDRQSCDQVPVRFPHDRRDHLLRDRCRELLRQNIRE